MDMIVRPRRLRGSETLRKMVRETRVDRASLIYPMFVMDGKDRVEQIAAMPGQYRYTVDRMGEALDRLAEAGVSSVMLFGIPAERDAAGSAGTDPEGVLNKAIADVRAEVGDDLVIMSDVCLDEFTDHGPCGVLDENGVVDNDTTLEICGRMAILAEGDAQERPDLIYLEKLPLFNPDGTVMG